MKKPKTGATRPAAAAPQQDAPQAIRIVLDTSSDAPIYYANYFEVVVAAHDITLMATRLPGKLNEDAEAIATATGMIHATPEVQVVMAPTMVPLLIRALQSQHKYWVDNVAKSGVLDASVQSPE